MPSQRRSRTYKYAAFTAGAVLLLGMLILSVISWQTSQRVERAAGDRLLAKAGNMAKRLNGGLTPVLRKQLRDEFASDNTAGEILISTDTGFLPLSPASSALAVPPGNTPGWKIQRWSDGKVYLSATATADDHLTVHCRQDLNEALAEVRQQQWQLFKTILPLVLLATLLGGCWGRFRPPPAS